MAWKKGGYGDSTQISRLKAQARKELEYRCAVPGCNATTKLELDHIKNVARGGTHTIDNAQWLCIPHHREKTRKESTLWQQRYRRTPQKSLAS